MSVAEAVRYVLKTPIALSLRRWRCDQEKHQMKKRDRAWGQHRGTEREGAAALNTGNHKSVGRNAVDLRREALKGRLT